LLFFPTHFSKFLLFSRKKEFNEAAEKRKEKKLFYAALVNESKEKQAELAQKYRDRAKERREKEKTGDSDYVDAASTSSTANYRAVAPGFSL
jgi:IK cytokine